MLSDIGIDGNIDMLRCKADRGIYVHGEFSCSNFDARNVVINGKLSMIGGIQTNRCDVKHLRVSDELHVARGEVKGIVVISGCFVGGRAMIDLIKFRSSVMLSPFVNVNSANNRNQFWGDIGFRGCAFEGDLSSDKCTVRGTIDVSTSRFNGALNLSGLLADPQSRLRLGEVFIKYPSDLSLPWERLLTVHQRAWAPAHNCNGFWWLWGDIVEVLRLNAWLRALGITRGGELIAGEGGVGERDLRRMARDYASLAEFMRSGPERHQYEDICIERSGILRDMSRACDNNLDEWERFKALINRCLSGWLLRYLTSPLWIFCVAAAVVVAFSCVYAGMDAYIYYNGTGEYDASLAWHEDRLNPLYFSVMSFVTLGYGDFAPVGILKLITSLEALLGVASISLFTVAWGRKMIR